MTLAVDWPRKTRDGRKQATSTYYELFLKILDDFNDFPVGYNLWKRLLSATVHAAKFETPESWKLVRVCCHALLDCKTGFPITRNILHIGLEAANRSKDTLLAADMICNANLNKKNNGVVNIAPSTLLKLVTMCIENDDSQSARRILESCIQAEFPSDIIRSLYSMVLTGFAQSGDLVNTEKMISDMNELKMDQR